MVSMMFEKDLNWALIQLFSFGVEKLHYTILEYAHHQGWSVAHRGLDFADPIAILTLDAMLMIFQYTRLTYMCPFCSPMELEAYHLVLQGLDFIE